MENSQIKSVFSSLVRLGIGQSAIVESDNINWNKIKVLADEQGLSAVVLDGIEELRKLNSRVCLPDKKFLTQWIGEVLLGYEYRYKLYHRAIAEMAGFYNNHGLKMMVLKGFSCSLTWPSPEHRHVGDIDIWLFGDYKKADALLISEKGIEVDNSHHHHTVFYWRDFMVENHYDFINVHHHKSNVELEKVFKRLGSDDTHYVEAYGEKVYTPSPNLHALFLIKHAMSDFTSVSVALRQVLDWAFHVRKFAEEIDWDWLMGILKGYHMMDFFNIMNAICVEDLGFTPAIFPNIERNPYLKEKVLSDILVPKYTLTEPDGFFPRIMYKYKRWRGNSWKHKMCYNESMWSAFWNGVKNHLLKPSSI